MSLEEELGRWAREALQDEGPKGPHVDDERLSLCAEGRGRLTRAERQHLAHCEECRDVLGQGAALPQPETSSRWVKWRWPAVFIPTLAAAAGLMFALSPRPGPESEYRLRGASEVAEQASLSFVATGRDGRRRVLNPGDAVVLGEQLGFRYGNPAGLAKTLTVLGWDGQTIHWYYPEAEGGAPAPLEGGPAAVNRRLPFDVRLGPDDRLGPLTLIAAFDAPPAVLAADLRKGTKLAPNIIQVTVQVQAEGPQ